MQHANGPGSRPVDVTILRELDELDASAVSASELAGRFDRTRGLDRLEAEGARQGRVRSAALGCGARCRTHLRDHR